MPNDRDQYFSGNKAPDRTEDSFYYQPSEIDGMLWNQSLPYQLMFVKATDDSTYTSLAPGTSVTYDETEFKFTLPIPPQDLSINMPMATSVQATLNGIVEQHGGAPFRDIVLTGTTGITPIKNNAGPKDVPNQNPLPTIFAGTVNAGAAAATSLVTTLKGTKQFFNNINEGLGDGDNRIPLKSTGYYQFRLLERFLESYQEIKKKAGTENKIIGFDPKDLRLALCIWKDEAIYLCSGVNFMRKRSASNPMEYNYTLQLKAWKRVHLVKGVGIMESKHEFIARNPNLYSEIMTRISAANETLQSVGQIFKSVIQDPLNRLREITRETQLGLKLAANLTVNINDLPDTIKADVSQSLYKNWSMLTRAIPSLPPVAPSILIEGMGKAYHIGVKRQEQSSDPTKGLKSKSPSVPTTRAELFKYFQRIRPSDIPLPSAVQKAIQAEKKRVSRLTRLDFEKARDEIRKVSADFADAIGAGGTTFNLIYNKEAPSFLKVPTDDEYGVLFALNEVATALDHLAASGTINEKVPNSIEYVAGLAQASGIAFRIPTSKFAVPMPYGVTLERLAVMYLNDANRWHEIATLNGLRAPYVDETGFSLPLLTNGDGRKLYVASKENLYINQLIWLSSTTQNKSKRRITNIQEIYPGYVEVSVDGEADLEDFTTTGLAVLEAFLPGTVNSQQIIYIPSNKEAPEDPKTKAIPGIDEFDPLLQISGVDLLLTQTGDLAITPDGDCRLAYGLQNIIQTVKLALSTSYGSLIQHPQYGLQIELGESTADVTAQDVVKSAVALFEGDTTFTKVHSATVVKDGPSCTITIVVGVAGLSDLVPITFTVVK